MEQVQGFAVKCLDVWPAAGPCAGNDVGLCISVDIGGCHGDAPRECGIVGEEGMDLRAAFAVENLDVWPAAGPCAGNDVGPAIGVDVAQGHVHAADKIGVGEELL